MPVSEVNISTQTHKRTLKAALVGNPNSGKSTIFNALTGLNQKIANFPGVTVDKKSGTFKSGSPSAEVIVNITDLPGTYSLFPKSFDEQVPFNILTDKDNALYPDVAIVVADASNLKRSLFLCTQIIDLKIPLVLVVNMIDIANKSGLNIDLEKLSQQLGVPVVATDGRRKEGIDNLRKIITSDIKASEFTFFRLPEDTSDFLEKTKKTINISNDYHAFIILHNLDHYQTFCKHKEIAVLKNSFTGLDDKLKKIQSQETINRYALINRILKEVIITQASSTDPLSHKLDKVLTHPVWGYLVFLSILFIIFQAIFSWSSFPMDMIERSFSFFSEWLSTVLPAGQLSNLFINGIVAGLSGIVVFIPQIALLFGFIAILEDTGYMSRVSFIMDKLLRKFGLNGKSVIPLVSSVACAVPAIMSARTIGNWKERIITIMVTPLISCSARLPVYTLIISLVIPADQKLWGIINYQGIALMALYLLGFVSALVSALVFKWVLRAKEKSYFIMEMPIYRAPRWTNVLLTMFDKVKVFLFDAGKVIIAISVILWVLCNYAPGDTFEKIEAKYNTESAYQNLPETDKDARIASDKLESSYAGIIGHVIEPVIRPLGYDWKIGISLITSFAAREVFVGTMATIYSVEDPGNDSSIREKMMAERDPLTGERKYTFAVGISLLLFYAFAMQCMSTLAVVYRETGHIKWPIIQFVYMSAMAYVSAFIAYQILK